MITLLTTSRYPLNRKELTARAEAVLRNHAREGCSVNIVCVGKRKMRALASAYGHGDVAKPVLSFPMQEETDDSGNPLLGEVLICYPQAVLLAAERDKSVDGMLAYLVEHGITNLVK